MIEKNPELSGLTFLALPTGRQAAVISGISLSAPGGGTGGTEHSPATETADLDQAAEISVSPRPRSWPRLRSEVVAAW